MPLIETFETIRPSIVALASRLHRAPAGQQPPPFPNILGTGFVVDERGIIMTNRHVADLLEQLPPNCAMAILFPCIEVGEGERQQPTLFRPVLEYNLLEEFRAVGPFYGQLLPDVAFVQTNVRGLAPLTVNGGDNVIITGRDVATAGFAMGTTPLIQENRIVQMMPFLRKGIVSSVYPFPSPHPHGFTLDIMAQGGSSGSPVFLPENGEVVGIIHAGYPGTNITFCVPGGVLHGAVATLLETEINLSRTEQLEAVLAEYPRHNEMQWDNLGPNGLPPQE